MSVSCGNPALWAGRESGMWGSNGQGHCIGEPEQRERIKWWKSLTHRQALDIHTSKLWPWTFLHLSTGSWRTSTPLNCWKWLRNVVLPLPILPSTMTLKGAFFAALPASLWCPKKRSANLVEILSADLPESAIREKNHATLIYALKYHFEHWIKALLVLI